MLPLLCLLLAARLRLCCAAMPHLTVQQGSSATLPCPGAAGDVSWSRYVNGGQVTLVTVTNGHESRGDERFGSQADNALLIHNVRLSDSTVYLCNGRQTVYLTVTSDPRARTEAAAPGSPRDHGSSVGLGPENQPAENQPAENQPAGNQPAENQPADLWKLPVGVASGAALVLLAVLSPRLCSGRGASGRKSGGADAAVPEVVYEEIAGGREPEVESPYYWPNPPTPAHTHLYSTVSKPQPGGCRTEECVYSLAQEPQT